MNSFSNQADNSGYSCPIFDEFFYFSSENSQVENFKTDGFMFSLENNESKNTENSFFNRLRGIPKEPSQGESNIHFQQDRIPHDFHENNHFFRYDSSENHYSNQDSPQNSNLSSASTIEGLDRRSKRISKEERSIKMKFDPENQELRSYVINYIGQTLHNFACLFDESQNNMNFEFDAIYHDCITKTIEETRIMISETELKSAVGNKIMNELHGKNRNCYKTGTKTSYYKKFFTDADEKTNLVNKTIIAMIKSVLNCDLFDRLTEKYGSSRHRNDLVKNFARKNKDMLIKIFLNKYEKKIAKFKYD